MPESAANLKREGVQVVEGGGLVASGFLFLLGLAALFAKELGGKTVLAAVFAEEVGNIFGININPN